MSDYDVIAFAHILETELGVELTCLSETGETLLTPYGSIVVMFSLISFLKKLGRASAKKAE